MYKGCHWLPREKINPNRLLSFQNPPGIIGEPTRGLDFSFMLPARLREKGMMLLDVTIQKPLSATADPFIIYDNRGRVLYCWPEDYTPTLSEVEKVANCIQ